MLPQLPQDAWSLVASDCPQVLLLVSSLSRDLAQALRVRVGRGEQPRNGVVNVVSDDGFVYMRDFANCVLILATEVQGVTAFRSRFMLSGRIRASPRRESACAVSITGCSESVVRLAIETMGGVGAPCYGIDVHSSVVHMRGTRVRVYGPGACVRSSLSRVSMQRCILEKQMNSLSATVVARHSSHVTSVESTYFGRCAVHLDCSSSFDHRGDAYAVREGPVESDA